MRGSAHRAHRVRGRSGARPDREAARGAGSPQPPLSPVLATTSSSGYTEHGPVVAAVGAIARAVTDGVGFLDAVPRPHGRPLGGRVGDPLVGTMQAALDLQPCPTWSSSSTRS